MRATEKFDKEHKRLAEWQGKTISMWRIKTEEI